jgi:hypothetical protein
MPRATIDGVQSTIEHGKDIGWGKYSVISGAGNQRIRERRLHYFVWVEKPSAN